LKVYLLDRDVEGVEGSGSDPIPFAEEAEQDVLSADVVVLEEAALVLGQHDYLAGWLGEALEHAQECRRHPAQPWYGRPRVLAGLAGELTDEQEDDRGDDEEANGRGDRHEDRLTG
jgi:hypothetical protein